MATTRRFELVEGSSSKFWQIEVDAASYTVTYGRIGTAGVSKTTTCDSAVEASGDAEKLVREKLKKGYQEVGGAPNWRPPTHIDTQEHVDRWLNYKVSGFDPEADGEADDESGRRDFPALRDLDKRIFRVGIGYDDADDDFAARLDRLFGDPKLAELRALVVGGWFSEACEGPPVALYERIIAHGSKLARLEGLFVGDVIQEECEISWLHQGDYGPVLRALPGLQHLLVRGGDGLRFADVTHASLRTLTVQTGGLSSAAVRDIAAATLPSLRTLTLWLGVEDYGGDWSLDDLAPILDGAHLPALEHLGLQDTERADEVAEAVARSNVLGRLRGLDLSMGTLTDDGAKALLAAPGLRKLAWLNLRHNYLSGATVRSFQALGIEVDVSDRQEESEDRYAEVTE
jgi:predicted DNA-binding WGR domain protein